MRKTGIAAAALLAALSAHDAGAQSRFAADIRAALAMPTGELAGADLGTALGFGATLSFRLQQHLHAYGGWDWLPFGADDSFAGGDLTFVETGYTFGLRFEHLLRATGRASYRVEGGGTYKHVEIEDDGGDQVVSSDHKLGFELGAGLVFPLGERLRVTPTARFRSLSPEFVIGPVTTTGTLRYFGLELGMSLLF